MRTRPSRLVLPALVLAALVIVIGVVMAKPHVPVALEPDAPHAAQTEVATFALG